MFLGAEEPWSILDTESTGPRRRLARLRPVCSAPSRAPAPAAITLEPCYGNIICDYHQRHLTIRNFLHCTRAVTVYNISRRRRNMLNRWRLYIHITWRGGGASEKRDKRHGAGAMFRVCSQLDSGASPASAPARRPRPASARGDSSSRASPAAPTCSARGPARRAARTSPRPRSRARARAAATAACRGRTTSLGASGGAVEV